MPPFKLSLRTLKFCSIVDKPAQPDATCLLIKRDGANTDITATAQFVKASDELGLAFFWAFKSSDQNGDPVVDLQNDIVQSDDDMIRAAAEFMQNGGAVDEQHNEQAGAGEVVFAMPMTPEIASAYSIDTKQSGLMIAIKPAPDVLAKLKSGEYSGVSIGGTGLRVPLEKSAEDAETEKRIAAEKARAHAQADELAKAAAYDARVVKEMHEWLDEMLAKHGEECAVSLAKNNVGSIGRWGQTWLDKHAAVEKADEPVDLTIEKAASFHKAAVARADKALEEFNAAEAAFGKGINAFINTETGRDLYRKYNAAHREVQLGLADRVTKQAQAQIDALTDSMEAQVEAFGIAHNLEPVAARKRLEAVSPTFKAQTVELSKAYHQRDLDRAIAENLSSKAIEKAESERRAAREAEAQEMARKAADARRTPAERKLLKHIDGIAAERGKGVSEATAWAMEHDPVAKTLYSLASEEQHLWRGN